MPKNKNFEIELTEPFLKANVSFKKSLKSLCEEIDKFNTDFLSTATLLTKIPYELAILVVLNLKYRQEEYIALMNTLYYDEFFSDIKKKEANKKSKFMNRLFVQKSMDYELFAIERLLTIGEIEHLIKLFIEDDKLKTTVKEILACKDNSLDKKYKILVDAHRFLSEKENAKINQTIMKKMGKFWLEITLLDILKRKETKGLNT